MSESSSDQFSLLEYAEQSEQKRETPSLETLMEEVAPKFYDFVNSLRNKERGKGRTNIIVLGTGGTFQSAETDYGLAPSGSLKESFEALRLPEDSSVNIQLFDLMNLDSSQVRIEHWRFLAKMIAYLQTEASDIHDAVIITHGTDTMAEGASYLSYMLQGLRKMVIFTGSQHPARKQETDARDQMERALEVAKIATRRLPNIAEVVVSCGLKVTRGTWAQKQGDLTTDAFGPWNQPNTEPDASDWEEAFATGEIYKLAPALIDFGAKKKTKGELSFARHATQVNQNTPFTPFTEIEGQANIVPMRLSGKDSKFFAKQLINTQVSVLTQLGSATADDVLVKIALKAAEFGKAILFQSPFHDSQAQAGDYAAGSDVAKSNLPVLNIPPIGLEAKINYAKSYLGMIPIKTIEGIGDIYSPEDLSRFYQLMARNLIGEVI